MNPSNLSDLPAQWNEAKRRAETYLRALSREFGSAERRLVTRVFDAARQQHRRDAASHPVTLVMEGLFALLPMEKTEPIAMAPPIERASMLPERTEFPLHDWRRRVLPRLPFTFAGVR